MSIVNLARQSPRWTPSSVWTRAREVLRQEGLRSLWFKVLGEVCYRRLAIIEKIFDGEARRGPPVEWELSKLSIAELPAYHAYHPGANLDELCGRLERGGCCFVMRHDGRIIHTCWIVKGTELIEYLGCEVRIGPDLGYEYEAFTVPEFRGRGVATARTRLMEPDLVADGYRGIVATVYPGQPGRSSLPSPRRVPRDWHGRLLPLGLVETILPPYRQNVTARGELGIDHARPTLTGLAMRRSCVGPTLE